MDNKNLSSHLNKQNNKYISHSNIESKTMFQHMENFESPQKESKISQKIDNILNFNVDPFIFDSNKKNNNKSFINPNENSYFNFFSPKEIQIRNDLKEINKKINTIENETKQEKIILTSESNQDKTLFRLKKIEEFYENKTKILEERIIQLERENEKYIKEKDIIIRENQNLIKEINDKNINFEIEFERRMMEQENYINLTVINFFLDLFLFFFEKK